MEINEKQMSNTDIMINLNTMVFLASKFTEAKNDNRDVEVLRTTIDNEHLTGVREYFVNERFHVKFFAYAQNISMDRFLDKEHYTKIVEGDRHLDFDRTFQSLSHLNRIFPDTYLKCIENILSEVIATYQTPGKSIYLTSGMQTKSPSNLTSYPANVIHDNYFWVGVAFPHLFGTDNHMVFTVHVSDQSE